MNFLNTSCCRRFAGTLGSSGRGSAENFWPETAPASISCCMRSYTGCRTPRPKDVTRWLYRLVTGTIFSAWNASPNMTSVFMTFAMVSPLAPSRMACCSSVRIMPMMDLPPFFLLYSNKKSNAVGRGGALLRPLGSCKSAQCPVGADAHIGPLGSYEFATDFRKKRYILPGRCGHRHLHPYEREPLGVLRT